MKRIRQREKTLNITLLIYKLDAYHTVVQTYDDVVSPCCVQEEANNSWKNLVSTSNILKVGVKYAAFM